MNGTPTQRTYVEETTHRVADTDDENLQAFAENVEEGDYLGICAELSNGHTLITPNGPVTDVKHVRGRFDELRFGEDGEHYLHLNPETGDYYFQADRPEQPADGLRLERIHYTPADAL